MKQNTLRSRKGFTLLEIMIAVSVLAIGLVAILQSQTQGLNLAADAQIMTTSALLTQQKMADVQTAIASGENDVDGSGDFGDEHPSYSWEVSTEPTDINGLRKMTLKVIYGEKGDQQEMTTIGYVFLPEELQ